MQCSTRTGESCGGVRRNSVYALQGDIKANPLTTQKKKDMVESTPAYLTGDIEAPRGMQDMGDWTMKAYTKEQQVRLHVDEEGRPVAQRADDKAQQEHPTEEHPTEALKTKSKQETAMVKPAAHESQTKM
jgi:hypothetical protein